MFKWFWTLFSLGAPDPRLRDKEVNFAYSSFQTHVTGTPALAVFDPTEKAGELKDQEDGEGLSWKLPVIIVSVMSKPRFPGFYILSWCKTTSTFLLHQL